MNLYVQTYMYMCTLLKLSGYIYMYVYLDLVLMLSFPIKFTYTQEMHIVHLSMNIHNLQM